jgi:cysteine-rich repeat protein
MKYFFVCFLVSVLLFLAPQTTSAINRCQEFNTVQTSQYICGNGVCETGEQCDDGEDNNDHEPDKCRPDCRFYGCGDGVKDSNEECDAGLTYRDPNRPNACRNNCKLPRCGDSIVDDAAPYNEECDDGNSFNDDGCSANCKISDGSQGGVKVIRQESDKTMLQRPPKMKKPIEPFIKKRKAVPLSKGEK